MIDWLNGRAPAFTTRTGTTQIAATGVAGLEAIVPISPVSDYDE